MLDNVPDPSLTNKLLPPASCQVLACTESELTAIASPDAPRVNVVPVAGSYRAGHRAHDRGGLRRGPRGYRSDGRRGREQGRGGLWLL